MIQNDKAKSVLKTIQDDTLNLSTHLDKLKSISNELPASDQASLQAVITKLDAYNKELTQIDSEIKKTQENSKIVQYDNLIEEVRNLVNENLA